MSDLSTDPVINKDPNDYLAPVKGKISILPVVLIYAVILFFLFRYFKMSY